MGSRPSREAEDFGRFVIPGLLQFTRYVQFLHRCVANVILDLQVGSPPIRRAAMTDEAAWAQVCNDARPDPNHLSINDSKVKLLPVPKEHRMHLQNLRRDWRVSLSLSGSLSLPVICYTHKHVI